MDLLKDLVDAVMEELKDELDVVKEEYGDLSVNTIRTDIEYEIKEVLIRHGILKPS